MKVKILILKLYENIIKFRRPINSKIEFNFRIKLKNLIGKLNAIYESIFSETRSIFNSQNPMNSCYPNSRLNFPYQY